MEKCSSNVFQNFRLNKLTKSNIFSQSIPEKIENFLIKTFLEIVRFYISKIFVFQLEGFHPILEQRPSVVKFLFLHSQFLLWFASSIGYNRIEFLHCLRKLLRNKSTVRAVLSWFYLQWQVYSRPKARTDS